MAERIGFIGVGLMGEGMAASLLGAGYPVTVIAHRNRTPVTRLVSAGAEEAADLAALAAASDIIHICAPGSPQVEAVVADLLPHLAKGTVLVADDDSAIRTVLNQALARAGYIPRTISNASTLWRWVQQGEGDVVVTDVVMPDENIFDLLPRITKMRPDLPVIVMSAQNTLMTALTAAERGAFEYMPKPFDLNELVAVVRRATTEPRRKRELPC